MKKANKEETKRLRKIGSKGGKNGQGKDKKNPERVAKEVIKQIKNKELVNVSKAMRKVGYSPSTITKGTSRIKKNPVYIKALANFHECLKDKRAEAVAHITHKKLDKSTPRDLAYITDVFSKNINLIEGKPTNIQASIGVLLTKLDKDADAQRKDNK